MSKAGNHPLIRLYRKAKKAKGHDFAQRLVQRLYRKRYGPAAVAKYEWREKDHPRGQPENAGEFREVNAVVGERPGEGVHLKLQHGSTIHRPHPQEPATESLPEPSTDVRPLSDEGAELLPGKEETQEKGPEPQSTPRTPEELTSIESALSAEKIVNGDLCPDASSANEVWFVKLEGGQQGVFKPTEKEFVGGRQDIPDNTLATREVAFYEIAKIVGLDDLVPVTVIHTAHNSGQVGSMQEFCTDAQVARAIRGAAAFDGKKDAARAIVFDFIMGNTDRHSKNWMIDSSGKLRLIDNGYCLPEKHGFQTLAFMGKRQNQLAFQYQNLPLDEAKAAWTDEAMDAIEAKLRELGISREALKILDMRRDILLESNNWAEAMTKLEQASR